MDRLYGIQEDSENIQSYSYGSDNSEEGIYVNMIFSCHSEYFILSTFVFSQTIQNGAFSP